MLRRLRVPFLIVALIAMIIVFCIEIGAQLLPLGDFAADAMLSAAGDLGVSADNAPDGADGAQKPGLAISYMALLDGILTFTLTMMTTALVIPDNIQGRVQGCLSLVLSFFGCLGGIGMLFIAITLVLLMIGMFLAVPFGTLVYLAIWGFFNRGAAQATLAILMTLKIVAAICLPLAHQRFLLNKGLVVMVVLSLVANVIISFLHGLVPIILVSITDAIAAIIVIIIGIIMAILMLIGSLPAIIKTLTSWRQ